MNAHQRPAHPAASPVFLVRHADPDEYAAFVRQRLRLPASVSTVLQQRARFVRAYPDLAAWFRAPLPERLGRLQGERPGRVTCRTSHEARAYLHFLAFRGYAWFDYDWLLALRCPDFWGYLDGEAALVRAADRLTAEAVGLGYRPEPARRAIRSVVGRLYLHAPHVSAEQLGEAELAAFAEAVRAFGERPDLARYFGSRQGYGHYAHHLGSALHLLRVVLYHRGQLVAEPHKGWSRPPPPPAPRSRMAAVTERYLAARRAQGSRPSTLDNVGRALRRFIAWLARAHPQLESFAAVTREHVLAYAAALETTPAPRTGLPLAANTVRGHLCSLAVFFRDVAAWGWEEVPGRPLLGAGDRPPMPRRVPRYIPDNELARLMPAIRALPCPYRRAALLVARWSGARCDEIRRLALDCLDAYPDGTPRLRLPAGKTRSERLVPLNAEAAAAIRALQAQRRAERGFRDDLTGEVTRRLFVRYGTMLSVSYLFDTALKEACAAAGLVDAAGHHTVSAHRFRHTVGTQLAERGARLHTIMAVLGHSDPGMSLVYAQLSDRAVLRDYQAVLGPGAAIAGPLAATLRAGALPASAVDWLKSNFLKTELELGHCLRLPQEGPCECDLYLTCAKFITTPAYAPRLRARRLRELELVADAAARGWPREVERHQCAIARIEQLLAELGEPLEDTAVVAR